jgi:hypothetical protein
MAVIVDGSSRRCRGRVRGAPDGDENALIVKHIDINDADTLA